jgi:D-alanyl-D-alanine carboxypeptidase (penicillin-binding protein 5/6)
LMKKGEKVEDYRHEVIISDLQAPLRKGDIVGKVVVFKGEEEISSMELAIDQNVDKASWGTLFKRTTRSMIIFDSNAATNK